MKARWEGTGGSIATNPKTISWLFYPVDGCYENYVKIGRMQSYESLPHRFSVCRTRWWEERTSLIELQIEKAVRLMSSKIRWNRIHQILWLSLLMLNYPPLKRTYVLLVNFLFLARKLVKIYKKIMITDNVHKNVWMLLYDDKL